MFGLLAAEPRRYTTSSRRAGRYPCACPWHDKHTADDRRRVDRDALTLRLAGETLSLDGAGATVQARAFVRAGGSACP